MPLDEHPFEALQRRLESERNATWPGTEIIVTILEKLPLGWPFDKLIGALKDRFAADNSERIRLMLETCMAEIRKQEEDVRRLKDTLPPDELQYREEALKDLLVDAARKAEATRARDRVRRIGLILANAATTPAADSDFVEELMRVAMALSDRDVTLLSELVRIEGAELESKGRLPRPLAHGMWERCAWGKKIDGELDSVFSKLEGYGLVSRIPPPNNLNIYADFQTRFALLKKGLLFVQFIKGRTGSAKL